MRNFPVMFFLLFLTACAAGISMCPPGAHVQLNAMLRTVVTTTTTVTAPSAPVAVAPAASLPSAGSPSMDAPVQTANPLPPATALQAEPTKGNMHVKLYFLKKPGLHRKKCPNLAFVEREIKGGTQAQFATMTELLSGPTEVEKSKGFLPPFTGGAKLVSLSMKNATAQIFFDQGLKSPTIGNCRHATLRRQIVATMMQFPTVKSVNIISGKNVRK